MSNSRAICLNCVDGRVQIPAIHWIKQHFKVDDVDMITEPGMDGFLADPGNSIDDICRKTRLCIEKNNAKMIIIAGHYDCQGNAVSDADHREHIQQAVSRIKEEFGDMPVEGLWVNSEFKGESIEN